MSDTDENDTEARNPEEESKMSGRIPRLCDDLDEDMKDVEVYGRGDSITG